MTIFIHPSPTADTRTCDVSKVTQTQLEQSSLAHISDVRLGLEMWQQLLLHAANTHDRDKLTNIDWFYDDFQSGFERHGWWDQHRKVSRHHLAESDGVPENVNLIDVLEYITDCVMAGMARSGSVRPIDLDPKTLQKAFRNTVQLLLDNVVVLK